MDSPPRLAIEMNFTTSKSPQKKALPKKAAMTRSIQSASVIPLPETLTRGLHALARRQLVAGLGEGTAICVSLFFLLIIGQALADWCLNLSVAVRAIFLALDVAVLGRAGYLHLYHPWRKRLGLAGAALLAQKIFPDFRGALIAAVQLANPSGGSTQGARELVDRTIASAAQRLPEKDFRKAIPFRKMWNWTLLALALMGITIGVAWWTWPASRILMQRLVLSSLPLPTNTIVVAVTKDLVVAIGSDVEIAARAQGVVPRKGRLLLMHAGGETENVVLTVDSTLSGRFSFSLKNVQRPLRYQFILNDGTGAVYWVKPSPAPALAKLECQQVWPEYTGLPAQIRDTTDLSLLIGSTLRVQATSTLPLKNAELRVEGGADVEMKVTGMDRKTVVGELPISSASLTGFSIALTGADGAVSIQDSLYRVEAVPDQPPVLTFPQQNEETQTITLSSKPVLEFSVSDDYGLKSLALCYRVEAPFVPGQKSVEDVVNRHEISLQEIGFEPGRNIAVHYRWAIADEKPAWREGWKIEYWLEATDNNTLTGPSVVRSPISKWSIISIEDKRSELAERLKQDAQTLKELSTRQENANKKVGDLLESKSHSNP